METIDIDIGIESNFPKLEFAQELKDCVAESRRVRGFEFKCVFESRFKGRSEYGFEYGFECVFKCVHTQSENAVSELW